MALIIDPDNLSQGGTTTVTDAVWGTPTGNQVAITSAGAGLPAITAADFIEVRDHSNPANNGLYVETGGSPTTSSITVTKMTGTLPPVSAGSESVTILGTRGSTNADRDCVGNSGSTYDLEGTLPSLAVGDIILISGFAQGDNNGLFRVTVVNTVSADYTVTKVNGTAVGTTETNQTVTVKEQNKNVHFDTAAKAIYLLERAALSTDGVTMLAFHSFAKEEWKSDAFLIAAGAFPMIGISFAAGQWQFGVDPSGNNNGWKPAENITSPVTVKTRRLFRNAGWDEINASGNTLRKYFNVSTLGSFEDSVNDKAYYRFGTDATDLAAAVDYEFAGPVNEPVLFFREFGNPPTCSFPTTSTITRASGSFVDDGYKVGGRVTVRASATGDHNGTFVLTGVVALTLTVTGTPFTASGADTLAQLAVDNANTFTTFIRVRDADPNGKTFQQANLASGGETAISSKVVKFPLANATDLDIDETDANIAANSPYTEIRTRYLPAAYNRDVDSATDRNFGIIVDVGTHSRENGVSNGTTLFTSAALSLGAGEDLTDYTGGTLLIREGTDQGTKTISGTPVNNAGTLEITLTAALTGSQSGLSFTMQRATPVTASKVQIYEKLHYMLRQAADMDSTSGVVNGRTADDLAVFVGPDLKFGTFTPTNPNGGGSGVLVEGFDANDTNNLFFVDNGGTTRNYPFVAAGTLVFNQALVTDSDGEFWLFYEYTASSVNADRDCVGNAGSTYDLEGTLPNMAVNDYILISGFAQSANNGLFRITAENTPSADYTVVKVDGTAVGTTETNQSVTVKQNPYPSPQGIIVDNNAAADIAGAINQTTVAFDFDYDNNVQGGRTAATDAAVVLVAAGLETAQVAVASGLTITRATGLSFSVTAATERNYA